jgi:hypothetical protein
LKRRFRWQSLSDDVGNWNEEIGMTEDSPVAALGCPAYIADAFTSGRPSPNLGQFVEYVFLRFDYAALGVAVPNGNGKAPLRPEATIRMQINLAFRLAVDVLKTVEKLTPEVRSAMGLPDSLELVLPEEVVE